MPIFSRRHKTRCVDAVSGAGAELDQQCGIFRAADGLTFLPCLFKSGPGGNIDLKQNSPGRALDGQQSRRVDFHRHRIDAVIFALPRRGESQRRGCDRRALELG